MHHLLVGTITGAKFLDQLQNSKSIIKVSLKYLFYCVEKTLHGQRGLHVSDLSCG